MENVLLKEDHMSRRVIPLEGTFNFRDLGGYPAADGRRVKWGKLFRAGNLSGMTEADLLLFKQLGIKRICDLRSEDEIKKHPDPVCEDTVWLHSPVIPDEVGTVRQVGDLAEARQLFSKSHPGEVLMAMNRQMASYVQSYRRVFAFLLEEPDAPFLFHCMAGKDRTGVVAALIFSILGVSRDVIIEDYLYTNCFVEEIKANLLNDELMSHLPVDEEVIEALLEARLEYITAFFDEIETCHDSVEKYLQEKIGLAEEEIEKLRESLLE
ncbi:tyrosine-protein phosphatase [Alkalihalobacillus sp. BA299]|uniref:tyrosine-protein phosphatase n=1 Tax=Alkalihalobacillus sp. BA299 TaxID=2815938 RepID=UPI001AD9A712|nr:tyrosine-protein phosphatase [Alkalihalobacillus sp. BA299]